MNLRKFFLYSLIISVVVSALLGIGVLLFGEFGDFSTRILMTTSSITLASILALASGVYLESRRGKIVPIAGISLSIAAAALCIFMIWQRSAFEEMIVGKITVTASMLATACALISLISLARLDARFRWSHYVIHIAVWTLCAILLFILWFEPESSSNVVSRLIGVLWIIVAALTIMTPVFHWLSRKTVKVVEDLDAEIAQLKARIEELERQKAALTTDVHAGAD